MDKLNEALEQSNDEILKDILEHRADGKLNKLQSAISTYNAIERKLLSKVTNRYEEVLTDYLVENYYNELETLHILTLTNREEQLKYIKKYKIDILSLTKLPLKHIIFGNRSNDEVIYLMNKCRLISEDLLA